jgi:hypothetical protein
LHVGDRGPRHFGEPLDDPPLAVVRLCMGVERWSVAAIEFFVGAGDEADGRIVLARQ